MEETIEKYADVLDELVRETSITDGAIPPFSIVNGREPPYKT